MRLTRTLLRAISSSSHSSSSSSMLFLSEQNVQEVLTMKDCLQVNRQAFQALANGTAQVPTRLGLPYGNDGDWTLFKPASLTANIESNSDDDTPDKDMMGIKVVSVRAQNPAQGKPLVPATILSIDPASGMVQGVIAGTSLTAARTATGSALSTLLCQRQRIQRVTIFGAGLQAKMHVYALSTALATQQDLLSESQRQYYHQIQQQQQQQQQSSSSSPNNNNNNTDQIPIPHLTIINRTPANAQALQDALEHDTSATWAHHIDIIPLDDSLAVAAAVADSQVIYTTTNTPTPLLDSHSLVTPGTHLASVGSYTPDMQELPARLVDHCRVLIDTPEAMQVGDLRHLATTPQHPVTLLGWALLQHEQQQPQSDTTGNHNHHDPQASWWEDDQWVDPQVHYCTFFKSVGTAIQDVLTANLVVDKARQLGIGTEIAMDE